MGPCQHAKIARPEVVRPGEDGGSLPRKEGEEEVRARIRVLREKIRVQELRVQLAEETARLQAFERGPPEEAAAKFESKSGDVGDGVGAQCSIVMGTPVQTEPVEPYPVFQATGVEPWPDVMDGLQGDVSWTWPPMDVSMSSVSPWSWSPSFSLPTSTLFPLNPGG